MKHDERLWQIKRQDKTLIKEVVKLSILDILLTLGRDPYRFRTKPSSWEAVDEANHYWRGRILDKKKLSNDLRRLETQGYIRKYYQDKEPVLALTESGMQRARSLQIDSLALDNPDRWDKKWRIITFDIPEEHREARDVFRKKIVDLGFLQVQKSVWIHPFDATHLVQYIRETYGLEGEIQ